MGFSAEDVDEKSDKGIEHYLPVFAQRLDVFCKVGENWSDMLQKTFNSLKNVCADLMDEEGEVEAGAAPYRA